jgi:hypothetical protein
MRVMENPTLRRALGETLRDEMILELPSDRVYEALS